MVSDSELVRRLQEFLRSSDLTTTTTAAVRRQLEADFAVDLSDKKAFIREQVDLFLQSHFEDDKDAAEGTEDGENAASGEEEDEGEIEEKEEEDEDDEEGSSNGSSKGKKNSKKETKEVKRRGGGFTKLCSLSPQLQKFVGVSELARTEVVKQLWAYIREHNLQEPTNRRKIVCDAKLQELFKVKVIDMFQMNKALSKHIWPLSSDGAEPSKEPVEKEKRPRKEKEEPKRKDKRQKSGNSGFLAPLLLSDALAGFFGTGESSMSRSDVVKRMWEYIKKNDLQDPSDKRRIICDEKLKELFEVDSFNGFTVSKLLTPHFIKTEK